MQQYRKNLGKVSLTAEGAWDSSKRYEILSIVYDEHTQHGFISKKEVPSGVDLYNAEYWMPLNVSGFADNNMIILSKKTSDASIQSYTLEEAVKSIASVGRKPGAILSFYNENTDRLDIGGRWELWQYNGVDVADWENVNSWDSIYYNYNKFVGWYRSEESLKKYIPFPEIGCYAYIGSDLNEAVIYRCDRKYVWTNTTEHVWDYIKVIVGGNVTVGENGNWYNNGVDTNIPASIKGENGKTPIIRNNNNILEVSYDNVNWTKISDEIAAWFRINNNKLEMSKHEARGWEVMSDYIAAWFRWQSQGGQQAFSTGKIQITRDGITWTDLSGEFVNNLRISRYIGTNESLPTSGIAEGTIYAKGPTYADGDTSHSNPIYRLWVYAWKGNTLAWQDNGEFQSIAAGVVQETGNSETEVMSQKAVTEKLSELGSKKFPFSTNSRLNEYISEIYSPNVPVDFIPTGVEIIVGRYISSHGRYTNQVRVLGNGETYIVAFARYYNSQEEAINAISSYSQIEETDGTFIKMTLDANADGIYNGVTIYDISVKSNSPYISDYIYNKNRAEDKHEIEEFQEQTNEQFAQIQTKNVKYEGFLNNSEDISSEFTWNEGLSINISGEYYARTDFAYSNPIPVRVGDVVLINLHYENVHSNSVINYTDADGSYYKSVVSGNFMQRIYVIPKDGYIALSSRNYKGDYGVKLYPQSLDAIKQFVSFSTSDLKKIIGDYVNHSDTIAWNIGNINKNGIIEENANKRYSSPIYCNVGDLIIVENGGSISSSHSVILSTNSDGSSYEPIIIGNNSIKYTFVVEKEGYYAICVYPKIESLTNGVWWGSSELTNDLYKNINDTETLTSIVGFDRVNLADTIDWNVGYLAYYGETDIRFNTSSTNYNYSNAIPLKKGDIIECTQKAALGVRPAIVVCDKTGAFRELLIMSTSETYSYRYVAEHDMFVRVNRRAVDYTFYWWRTKLEKDAVQMLSDYSPFFDSRTYLPIMQNAKLAETEGDSVMTPNLVLTHYSDIHGDVMRTERIIGFTEKFSNYIDDILFTGDICGSRYSNYQEAFDSLSGMEKILMTIGNHDVYDGTGTAPEDDYANRNYWATQEQKYSRYMKNIGNWGVVQPTDANTNNLCYYYKDYADMGIRLVVLDCMAFDNAQLSWLQTTLNDAKTNSLSVVIAVHFIPTKNLADFSGFDCSFNSYVNDTGVNDFTSYLPGLTDAVDAYINNGGEFICYLAGHTHYDLCGTITSHPNQLYIAVSSAKYIAEDDNNHKQHVARKIGQSNEDQFNIVAFDTYSKHIKVARVGATFDRWLRHRGTMLIDYANKKLLSCW